MNAVFIHDAATGLYYPANKVAIAESGKLELTEADLLKIKTRGIRTLKTNGEEIHVSVQV